MYLIVLPTRTKQHKEKQGHTDILRLLDIQFPHILFMSTETIGVCTFLVHSQQVQGHVDLKS